MNAYPGSAPVSRAGDDAPVIANFFFSFGSHSTCLHEDCFGGAPKPAREPRALPGKLSPRHVV